MSRWFLPWSDRVGGATAGGLRGVVPSHVNLERGMSRWVLPRSDRVGGATAGGLRGVVPPHVNMDWSEG